MHLTSLLEEVGDQDFGSDTDRVTAADLLPEEENIAGSMQMGAQKLLWE